MKVQQIFLVVLVASLATSLNANLLETYMKEWKESDSVFSPKLFKFLLMLPTTNSEESNKVDNKIHDDIHQISITDNEVHPSDMVTSSLEDYFNKGGNSKYATIISQHDEVRDTFRRMIMDIEPKNDSKLALVHGGKQVASVKPQNLKECLKKNKDLGAQLYEQDGKVYFVFQDNKFEFNQNEFETYKPFLTDVCFMVEYIRMHFNDFNKNMVIHHLESVKSILNTEYSKQFLQFLYNGVRLVRKTVVDKFGKDGASFMVSTFVQNLVGAMPNLNHNRFLQGDAADEGTAEPEAADPTHDMFLWCLRCCFGVSFSFLILYASVYIYRIEVYKDSLVYAKFISTKKDKKN